MGPDKLELLFNPKSIAVFGASELGQSVGSMVFANLLEGSFSGPVVPINPKYKKVSGITCYPSARSALKKNRSIDLAVIATPAETVPEIIRQCGKSGIHHAIILSAGFGETDKAGKALDAALAKAARKNKVRFIGPNCVGLVRPNISMNATFLKSATPKGNIALVSQSGALCSAISDWAEPHNLGFSALVSLGNSTDTGFGDVLKFLTNDSKTDAILLYVEGIRYSRSFISSLRMAAREKPIIVLKAGRHNISSKAAHTHTGALIGSDAVFDAALERAGAVRVDTFGQLFAAAEILSASTRSKGSRLCIITNGGGAGVLAADRAGDLNLVLPSPSQTTLTKLNKTLSPYWSRDNPIDILGDAKAESYGIALSASIADENFDGVLVMLTPQAMTNAETAAQAVIDAIPKNNKKPVLTCWMGETSVAKARKLLSENGVPDFLTPERAVEAFSYLAKHHRNKNLALEVPGPFSRDHQPDIKDARGIIEKALDDGRTMLSDIESKLVLKAFDIPVNEPIIANSLKSAQAVAAKIGYPVAVKINSPQISHKSDIGGVRIGVMNRDGVAAAWKEVTKNASTAMPEAEILGVTIEPMAKIADARELLIGTSKDPIFGPTILFGAGGTMVEVLRDSAVSLPPLNTVLANRLVDRTKVSRLLETFRGKPGVDRGAVINVLLRVSDLVCEIPEIEELDINPLLAGPSGVISIDARIRVGQRDKPAKQYDHMAIQPYPRHLVQKQKLDDGTILTIRPIRPEDAQSEQDFVRSLSSKTKQFRFMHAMTELTPTMLARFTQIDYDREMALIASTQEDGEAVQHGVARYIANQDDTSCEFAIVVADRQQHMGIGTRLMKALMDAAWSQGITLIEGTVLADNYAMLELMKDLKFTIEPSTEERGVMDVYRKLKKAI